MRSRPGRARFGKIWMILASALVGLGASTVGSSAASASTLGGTATIENITLSAALSGPQASTQPFGISLPAGAACDSDTETVVSYMVPQSVYPSLVAQDTFSGGDPGIGLGYFNVGSAGAGVSPGSLLAPQPTTAGTGQIGSNVDGPFQWGPAAIPEDGIAVTGSFLPPYNGALIPTGRSSQVWESGLACINTSGTITDYWNAAITFTTSASDPNLFTWIPTPGSSDPQSEDSPPPLLPEAPLAAALPLSGGLILAAGVVVVRRRRKHTTAPPTS
jgi:hypothetical protein